MSRQPELSFSAGSYNRRNIANICRDVQIKSMSTGFDGHNYDLQWRQKGGVYRSTNCKATVKKIDYAQASRKLRS